MLPPRAKCSIFLMLTKTADLIGWYTTYKYDMTPSHPISLTLNNWRYCCPLSHFGQCQVMVFIFNTVHFFCSCLLVTCKIEPRHDKTCLREAPTRPDTNRPAQSQKLARVLKFRLQNLEIYYLSSEQQRRWSDCTDAQADLRICCLHMT